MTAYPWTDTRLAQAEDAARTSGCACAGCADVVSLVAEVRRLNALVDTVSRALSRYQQEDDIEVGGDAPADHPYQRRGSWSHDDWCAVDGCTSKASAHQEAE